jgi:hypothetical protein
MLAGAGMNFKRMMNKWKLNPLLFLFRIFQTIFELFKTPSPQFFIPFYAKMNF